jgi:hypothetical protein
MGQARRVENEDPLVDMRAFYFQKAVPLILKRIKVNRVHFGLGNGEFVHDDGEESFGRFGLKYSLFLFFKGKGKHIHFKF